VDSRRVVRVVTSGVPQLVQRVEIYDSVLRHIEEQHPEEFRRILDVYSTIAEPTRVHQSRTHSRSILFVSDDFVSTGGDPLRVPVKVFSDGTGIMTTAYFTSSKDQGELLWSETNAE